MFFLHYFGRDSIRMLCFLWYKKRFAGGLEHLLLYERRSTREAGEVIVKSDEIAIKTKIVAVDIMHNYPVLFVSLTIHPFFHKEGDRKKDENFIKGAQLNIIQELNKSV